MPLYARLSSAEQHRVFQPHDGRRVVLSTNVAETSITVPGVRYVVDTGEARISRYSHRLRVQRLPIEPVAKSSANQRAGRCGRVAPGICIRLYGEADFEARPDYTEPEILRTSLASVILQMAALGLGDVAAFPFLDPPDAKSIRDGLALLEELGALDDGGRLTQVGRRLAQLPIDPRFGRMVLEAERLDCVREVLVIASALSIQDVRETPTDQREQATAMHRRFRREGSDFLGTVALWDHLREQQRALSGNQFRRLCRAEFLHYVRVREWQDLHSQLRQTAGRLGVRPGTSEAHPDHVHQALLAGLLSHLGMRERETREFRGARGAKFAIVPGSVLAKKPPRWVVAAELVETSRLWGRVAAAVQPEWAEQLGAHLVKRSYGEPEWDPVRGTVTTTERVTLYGLPIVAGRRIGYHRIDARVAHELFVRHALVLNEWDTRHRFVERNRAFLQERRAWEDRVRTPVAVLDDERLERFFRERVPAEVCSVRQFDRWWRDARSPRSCTARSDGGGAGARCPGRRRRAVPVGVDERRRVAGRDVRPRSGQRPRRHRCPRPGGRVEPDRCRRVRLGGRGHAAAARRGGGAHAPQGHPPAADPARRDRSRSDRTARARARSLRRRGGADGHRGQRRARPVQRHRPVPGGRPPAGHVRRARRRWPVLGAGKDLHGIRRSLSREIRAALLEAFPGVERTGLTTWEIGDLQPVLEVARGDVTVRGYPGLVDDGSSVSLRVFSSPALQRRVMRGGVRRLLVLESAVSVAQLERQLSNASRLAISAPASTSVRSWRTASPRSSTGS